MDDKLVTVAKFRDEIQAELAKIKLEEAGIKAVVTGSNAFNVLSSLPAVESIRLQVRQSQAEEALEIVNAQNQGETN